MKSDKYETFRENVKNELESLYLKAKNVDELAYIFSLLGLNSGIEDFGWQPINETLNLVEDFISISNSPLRNPSKIRLMLLMYCQITEASFLYHIIYNMLLTIDNEEPPRLFNFLDKYRGPVPPTINTKIKSIKELAMKHKLDGIIDIFSKIYNSDIRNAVTHADFILHENELRLKHRGDQIGKIHFEVVTELVNFAVLFFQTFFQITYEHKSSYKNGYVISNRKDKAGKPLSSIEVIVDESGLLSGFQTSDPYPIW
ncbi:MAG: hypothetical protein ISR78_09130 [Spirochaetia bacterium]|nr:hypothetical protein [Spirochaetia bacterium]